ncbi:GIY-YIG nuclease family protein [Candidatus Gracilibacteria bacterium]|nr:GIY-YIG nuclease family protein [Candidatus Gracilibacteria bacterium]
MKYVVYVLKSERDQKRYIGVTGNIDRRLAEHERGKVKSTKQRRPLKLIHREEFEKKEEAWAREKFLKTGKGREFLDSIE